MKSYGINPTVTMSKAGAGGAAGDGAPATPAAKSGAGGGTKRKTATTAKETGKKPGPKSRKLDKTNSVASDAIARHEFEDDGMDDLEIKNEADGDEEDGDDDGAEDRDDATVKGEEGEA